MMDIAARRLTCERCGQEFGCSRDDIGGCWCATEPYRLPMPASGAANAFKDCLCPACLRAIVALAATPPSAQR
jgi:Cysteine-rich CWC